MNELKEILKQFNNDPKTPDRFLREPEDPEEGYITPERLNTEFKMLEWRIKQLELKKGK